MSSTPLEILRFVKDNDVKFIRLTFCDVYGTLKNIAVMPGELERAFESGIPFDASSLGYGSTDLLLFPDFSTLSVLPWRPASGRVVRFFCTLKNPDGTAYSGDMRTSLTEYINQLRLQGYSCEMGTRCEFYLFETDEHGRPTAIPHDTGGYLDVAPLDRCENPRREICLSLEEMGFSPRSSCHKHGPGQNEIEFRENEPVTAADDMAHYKSVVKSIAAQSGLFASFMPLPPGCTHGSALTISLSVKKSGENIFSRTDGELPETGKCFISGILRRIPEMTAFLNPTVNSYRRFGTGYAPGKITCSADSPLIRIPHIAGTEPRIEIRSADPACDPYIAFKLLLAAGMEGIRSGDSSLYNDGGRVSSGAVGSSGKIFERLPDDPLTAVQLSTQSSFIRENLPDIVTELVLSRLSSTAAGYTGLTPQQSEAADRTNYFEYL
ncbi:MAG: glutamine synthetase [Ruminococcus sp.]|nr:glutamine synthetase [Ruminococcus sp.]